LIRYESPEGPDSDERCLKVGETLTAGRPGLGADLVFDEASTLVSRQAVKFTVDDDGRVGIINPSGDRPLYYQDGGCAIRDLERDDLHTFKADGWVMAPDPENNLEFILRVEYKVQPEERSTVDGADTPPTDEGPDRSVWAGRSMKQKMILQALVAPFLFYDLRKKGPPLERVPFRKPASTGNMVTLTDLSTRSVETQLDHLKNYLDPQEFGTQGQAREGPSEKRLARGQAVHRPMQGAVREALADWVNSRCLVTTSEVEDLPGFQSFFSYSPTGWRDTGRT
ncbi:MAG: hypothetical protein AAEJ46_05865, partial [Planctomycetota bacterium]